MAQKSKKEHIIESALPLFLKNGFKGTSIDMVVKASEVSKPTVYNHFPDKSALMLALLQRWIERHKPLILPLKDSAALDRFIDEHWLTDEAVRLYAIVIGEGFRFPAARALFWQNFDALWRKAFAYVCAHTANLERESLDLRLDQQLLRRLRKQ